MVLRRVQEFAAKGGVDGKKEQESTQCLEEGQEVGDVSLRVWLVPGLWTAGPPLCSQLCACASFWFYALAFEGVPLAHRMGKEEAL